MLKKPVVTEVRTPTNTWSGLGFSKSMPAETIKELRRANHVPYKPSMSTTYEVRQNRLVPPFLLVSTNKEAHQVYLFGSSRVPRCPCPDPAAGKASAMAATRTTGERGTAVGTGCPATPSSPRLSAAPRGSRTNLVSLVLVPIPQPCSPQLRLTDSAAATFLAVDEQIISQMISLTFT